jgi:signal transduction histidine kinase
MTIRGRLFVATLAAVVVSITLSLGLGAILVRRSVERSVITNLGRQADLLAVREENAPIPPAGLRGLRVFLASQGTRLLVFPRPPPAAFSIGDSRRQAIDAGRPVQGQATLEGQAVLFAARQVGDQVLVLSRPAALGAADWRPFLASFLVAALLGAAVAGLASFVVARTIARPVRQIADATASLAAGTAPGPVPVEGTDELAILSASFNHMADRLARSREAEQTFLLSVSHELKTPLTAILGYAEALEEGAVDGPEAAGVISKEALRLERLVQDLLDLARLNAHTFTARREPLDLAAVATEIVVRYESRARLFGVALAARAVGPEPAGAVGDHDRIVQVVSNLVEDALRLTPSGGSVTVTAGPGSVEVTDTGPGLSSEDLPRAFERFFLYRRYGGERPVGSGLGLAIVKDLTEAMGGQVSVQSTLGAGTRFVVRLPHGPAPIPPPPSV